MNLKMTLHAGVIALLLVIRADAADTNAVRIAIGPFFTSAGNPALANAAAYFPDLLTAALSQENRFQLVERVKVAEVWNEMQLAEASLTEADTVARFGRILACDWLVSGMFVVAGTNTQVVVKVTDIHSGVLLDLETVPYRKADFAATAGAIGDFLARARSRAKPREFIALGNFEDQSLSTTREDWSPRLMALIEKQFLAAGYGVVEREAVAPIFSEYQFAAAGLTGEATNRVKLRPAFWVVDGACKWLTGAEDKLSVTLRIQKMGGALQVFSFAKPAGAEVEKTVFETIRSAVAGTGSTTPEQALAGEEKIRSAHLDDLVQGRGETAPVHYATDPTFITITDAYGGTRQVQMDPSFMASQQSHAMVMLKTLQQAILLNPKDYKAKWTLGMSWYCSREPSEKQQGQEMLEEVAASGDANYATKAKNWLADFKSGKLTLEPDFLGQLQIVTHGQPASVPAAEAKATIKPTPVAPAPATQMADAAVPERSVISNLPSSAHFESGVTAVKLQGRDIYIATGNTLQVFNLDTQTAQEVNLPMKFQSPITAIEAGEDTLWLGTDQGLLRVSTKDGSARLYGEKDGLPSKSITALRLVFRRLFMGVGFQNGGTFGYLDLNTQRITFLTRPATLQTGWSAAMQEAPDAPVFSINTMDGYSLWVSTAKALQHLDLAASEWSLATSGILRQVNSLRGRMIAQNSKYLIIPYPIGGVAICQTSGTNWISAGRSADVDECYPDSLAADPANPDHLWIGGSQGKITLLDMATSRILCKYQIFGAGSVDWTLVTTDKVVCIADAMVSDVYDVYCIDKSAPDGSKLTAARPIAVPDMPPAAAPVGDLQNRFLRQNFSKFVPVEFQKDGDGDARLQRLDVQAHMFSSGDSHYCGFKFTVPTWMDGDFVLLNSLAKTESQKDFSAKYLDLEILSDQGEAIKFESLTSKHVQNCPRLKLQLPYTSHYFTRTLSASALVPGKTYAVWFGFGEADFPDIAFAITADSQHGRDELGILPASDSASSPIIVRTPPASAEELRSEVEKAFKTEDTSALKSLIYWQGASAETKESIQEGLENILDYQKPAITLAPLPPFFTGNNEVNGVRSRPSVPPLGMVDVRSTVDDNYTGLPYGKIGDGYYISINIDEPIQH
jgi:hypothetical protein